MHDTQPQRNWSPQSIGTVERADPVSRYPGDVGAEPRSRIIEAGIQFKTQETFGPLETTAGTATTYQKQEARTRKALWRYVHDGLDAPLFEALLCVRRAVGSLSPYDPAQAHLKEAVDRIMVLIDHVLGNEEPIDPGSVVDADWPRPVPIQLKTQEKPDERHGDRPGQRIAD